MKLQTKIWLGTAVVITIIMCLDMVQGYRSIEAGVRENLDKEARIIRAMLMATRRVYHAQFLASGLPLDDQTLGFLPAHALPRISADFPNWFNEGLSFNNVSDRPRNQGNKADANELVAMQWFRANKTALNHTGVINNATGAAFYHFTAPIWIESYCLKCHGDREKAPLTIRDNYTEGYSYKVGDLVGVMSIKLPMDEIRHNVWTKWKQRFWIRLSGYVFLMILLGVMMQRLVTRRLAQLEIVTRRLEVGDLTARMEISGGDEVASLARGFNRMAEAIVQNHSQLVRLNQIYAALSQTNETIVRVENEAELLNRVCRIAVEFGGARLAFIGKADETNSRIVVITSFGGGFEYIDGIYISSDSSVPEGRGPTGTAWRTASPVVIQNFSTDESTRVWQERARSFGWGGSAAFPILRGGKVQLVFTLYHAESYAFDSKMIALLTEMSMDIGYALDRIDLVAEQLKTNNALRESEEKYRTAVTTSLDGFWLVDCEGRLLEVNDAYVKFSGYSREELLGLNIRNLETPESSGQVSQRIEKIKKIGADLFESRHRSKSGDIKPVEISVAFTPDQGGRFSVFVRDLSKRKEAEAQIDHLSHFDSLTGLPNRSLFTDRFSLALANAQRNNESLALIFLDLDHFKNINDNLGHRIGDLLLIELTGRFQAALCSEDTVSRLGGDEFILLLPHAAADSVVHVAEHLLEKVSQPVLIEGNELIVTPSMGIAFFPTDGENFETLLRKADTAANWAKQEGRNTYRFFATEMQVRSARILLLETSLRRALERDELLLYYQPQVSLKTGAIVGVEALIRWHHPEHGLIPPAEFIPIAESSGLILSIGEWVLNRAMRDLKSWMDRGLPIQLIAVNLSPVQFRQQNLPAVIERLLAENGLPPSCLELEVTEGVTMNDPVAAIAMLDALHAQGIHISIDDFGTGYSSLNYLKRFQIDKLKIDQSFVRDITTDPDDKVIVMAIINLAKNLGFQTIAEGVETLEQQMFLREQGCEEMQGYLFSKPVPIEQLEALLRSVVE